MYSSQYIPGDSGRKTPHQAGNPLRHDNGTPQHNPRKTASTARPVSHPDGIFSCLPNPVVIQPASCGEDVFQSPGDDVGIHTPRSMRETARIGVPRPVTSQPASHAAGLLEDYSQESGPGIIRKYLEREVLGDLLTCQNKKEWEPVIDSIVKHLVKWNYTLKELQDIGNFMDWHAFGANLLNSTAVMAPAALMDAAVLAALPDSIIGCGSQVFQDMGNGALRGGIANTSGGLTDALISPAINQEGSLTYSDVSPSLLNPVMQKSLEDLESRKNKWKDFRAGMTAAGLKDGMNTLVAGGLSSCSDISDDSLGRVMDSVVNPVTQTLCMGGVYATRNSRPGHQLKTPGLAMTLTRKKDAFAILDDARRHIKMSGDKKLIDNLDRAGEALEAAIKEFARNVIPPSLHARLEQLGREEMEREAGPGMSPYGNAQPISMAWREHIPPVVWNLFKSSTAVAIFGAALAGALGAMAASYAYRLLENSGVTDGVKQLAKYGTSMLASTPGNAISATQVVEIHTNSRNA